jgi:hypothetical protein
MDNNKVSIGATTKSSANDWDNDWGAYYIWADMDGNITFNRILMGSTAPVLPANAQLIWIYAVYRDGAFREPLDDRRVIVSDESVTVVIAGEDITDRMTTIIDFENINQVVLGYQGQYLGGGR